MTWLILDELVLFDQTEGYLAHVDGAAFLPDLVALEQVINYLGRVAESLVRFVHDLVDEDLRLLDVAADKLR